MNTKDKDTGISRRDFVKTVGLAGMAVAGVGVPEPSLPRRRRRRALRPGPGETGSGQDPGTLSSRNLEGMFDALNNQLLLKQALKWGVTFWDTAESYGTA